MNPSYDGQTHYHYWRYGFITVMVVTALVAVAARIFGFYTDDLWWTLNFINFNYFITRWIDPDLDQLSFTSADNRMIRELKIIGVIFAFYWTLYAFLLFVIIWSLRRAHPWYGAHRSYLSHSYFGTFVRIVWFNLPLWKIIEYLPAIPMTHVYQYLIGQVISFVIADTIHYAVDNRRLPMITIRR